jgi:hypothetical protein
LAARDYGGTLEARDHEMGQIGDEALQFLLPP